MRQFPLTIDQNAVFNRDYRSVTVQPPKPTFGEKVYSTLAYGAVILGVGIAVFVVSPANARDVGSMNHEARVIRVSPSIVQYGTKIEQKLRADIARDNNQFQNDLVLENQRSINERMLEQDRAYYKKLEWQRKQRNAK